MSLDQDAKNLAKLATYVPEGTAKSIFDFLKEHKVHLKIKKPRTSKLGDYRHPYGNLGHRISINGNLNKYAFLITMLHEMAHLVTWEAHGHRHIPHGKEWKSNFQKLLHPVIVKDIFPDTIHTALKQYIQNPAASSCSDINLARALNAFDSVTEITVESCAIGTLFVLENDKVFRKGPKLRKRYKCLCVSDNRMYYVSPLATVVKILENDK